MDKSLCVRDLWYQYWDLKNFINGNKSPDRWITLSIEDEKVVVIVRNISTRKILKKSKGVDFPPCSCGGKGIFKKYRVFLIEV
jgi:hypothetical protein